MTNVKNKEEIFMNKKRILMLAVAFVLSASAAMAEYDPEKEIDLSNPIMTLSEEENTQWLYAVDNVEVREVNGIKMIPLRSTAEGLAYIVTWNGETRSIELIRGANYIKMSIDDDKYSFSRMMPESLGAAPTLVDGVTYVPASIADKILGAFTHENQDGTMKVVLPDILTVSEVREDGSLFAESETAGEVILHISDETVITADDKTASAEDIKVGTVIAVEYSDAMTMSIPPQTTAVKINIENTVTEVEETKEYAEKEGTISEITEDGLVVVKSDDDEYGMALIVTDTTKIKHGMDRRIYKIDDLEVGMKISAKHSLLVTKSLPGQSEAYEIDILD